MFTYNQHNFPWESTNCPIIILIPNFGRKNLLIPTLQRFKTELSQKDYKFLIINDGIFEDLSDLEKYNLLWFNFEREPTERNGLMVRNFAIRRLKCQTLVQRDPEIVSDGSDYLLHIAKNPGEIYRPHKMLELQPNCTQTVIDNPHCNLSKLDVLREWRIDHIRWEGFHCNCGIPLQLLKDLGGYDEDFSDSFGWEDTHMLARLRKSNIEFNIDKSVTCYHLWHPVRRKFHRTININGPIYDKKMQNLELIANQGKEWGNGT